MRRDAERLQDILDAIDRIQARIELEQLQEDELLQVWVLYHLQIIGEAARTVSSYITQRYPQIPWTQIIGLRNRVVHEYFAIDLDIITDIVTNDLPTLKAAVTQLLQDLSSPDT